MEQLLLIATIATIAGIVSSTKKRNRNRKQQAVTVRNGQQQKNYMSFEQLQRILAAEQKQLEKLKKEDQKKRAEQQKRSERIRTAEFKAEQAENDMIHLQQQQSDYLQLYGYFEQIANDQYASDKKRQAAFARMITLDNKIRSINKNIETAQYKIDTLQQLRNA